MDYVELEPMMRGQWREFILAKCGVDTEQKKKGVGHECPVCGGKDRAHFREQDGRVFLFCRGACGNANSTWGQNTCTTPEELCQRLNGWDFRELVEEVSNWVGVDLGRSRRESKPVRRRENKPTNKQYREHHDSEPQGERQYQQKNAPNEAVAPRTPINQVIAMCQEKEWHTIRFCKENAITGESGIFLTLNGNLFVPVGVDVKGGRFAFTGGVEFADKPICYGSVRGAVAYFGNGEQTLFTTSIVAALTLYKQYRVTYSPDRNASKKRKFDAAYVGIDTSKDCAAQIDMALAHFGYGTKLLLPSKGFKSDHLRQFNIQTHEQLNKIANHFDELAMYGEQQ